MNATKKESRKYSSEELLKLSLEAKERNAPVWVSRELLQQSFDNVRNG